MSHQNNTKPQTLRATQEAIAKLGLSCLSTVQSRLGTIRLSPFSKIEGIASWCMFDSNKKVKRTARIWLKKQSVESFCDGFKKCAHIGRANFNDYFPVSCIKTSQSYRRRDITFH